MHLLVPWIQQLARKAGPGFSIPERVTARKVAITANSRFTIIGEQGGVSWTSVR